MGVIIEMPIRGVENRATISRSEVRPLSFISKCESTSAENSTAQTSASFDFSGWMKAPKERTAAYFPTYSAVSRAMQSAMRSWVREWFQANPEILLRPHSAYPVLVFQCTHPFSGRPTNIFTYDIQQTEALNRAFRSAANKLGAELKSLNTKELSWLTREHYFAYRSNEVVKYVMKNRRGIYKMLNVETVLIDSILKFALIDIPKVGLEEATIILRRAFATQLRRFSDEIDLTGRVDDLLAIATNALEAKLAEPTTMPAPRRSVKVVELPLRPAASVVDIPLAA